MTLLTKKLTPASAPSTAPTGLGLAADLEQLQQVRAAQDAKDWKALILACGSTAPPGIETIALELARLGRSGEGLESAVATYTGRLALAATMRTGEAVEGDLQQAADAIREVEHELAEVQRVFAERLDPMRARRTAMLATQAAGLEARTQLIAGGSVGDEGDPGKIQNAFESERGQFTRVIEDNELRLSRADAEGRVRLEAEIDAARQRLAEVDKRKADWLATRLTAAAAKLIPENF